MRYTDPDGRQTAVPLPTGESLVGMTAEEMGACFDELLADCGPAAFFIFVGLFIFSLNGDSAATQRNQDTQKEEANEVSKSIKQGAQAAAPSPAPNNKNSKPSRNKPEEHGEPDSTKVERNPDGSVKRVTQFDKNGDFIKEIRPNEDNGHGVKGPQVKEHRTNTNPKTGETYINSFKYREATDAEKELLNQ